MSRRRGRVEIPISRGRVAGTTKQRARDAAFLKAAALMGKACAESLEQIVRPAPAVAPSSSTTVVAIYDGHPDRPTAYVVRAWACVAGARPQPGPLQLARDLDAARALVPVGFRRVSRQKHDPRAILEVWVPRAEPAS